MKIIYSEHTGVKLMEAAEQTGNYRNYLSLNTNCENLIEHKGGGRWVAIANLWNIFLWELDGCAICSIGFQHSQLFSVANSTF
jgi:hypothetical protein